MLNDKPVRAETERSYVWGGETDCYVQRERDRGIEETMAADSWITTLQVTTDRIRLDERSHK
jgi:hypothetical protein